MQDHRNEQLYHRSNRLQERELQVVYVVIRFKFTIRRNELSNKYDSLFQGSIDTILQKLINIRHNDQLVFRVIKITLERKRAQENGIKTHQLLIFFKEIKLEGRSQRRTFQPYKEEQREGFNKGDLEFQFIFMQFQDILLSIK